MSSIPMMSDEKSKLLVDESQTAEGTIQEPKKNFFQRHPKKLIALVVCVFVLIIIFAVAVPQGIKALMGKFVKETAIEIDEMEVTNIQNGTAYIRIMGSMSVNSPIEVQGYSEDAYFDLLIADPQDRSQLANIGTVFLPAMQIEGAVIKLNVSTTMVLVSDRLFHGFINDVLYNQTVTTYMQGVITVTAKIPVYGDMTVTEELTSAVSIDGMNGLDFDLLRMDLYESTNDTVSLWFELVIRNPSQFYSTYPLPLYFVNIRLYFEGTFIGLLEPQDLLIGKGESFNVAIGELIRTPENEAVIGKFLSDYIMGFDVPVIVNGTAKVDVGLEKNPYYPAHIYVDWVMPGITDDLILAIYAPIDVPKAELFVDLVVVGALNNPLDFNIEVLLVEFDGYVGKPCNKTVGKVVETYYDAPLLVPSKTPICVPMDLSVSIADALCIAEGLEQPGGLEIYAQNGSLEVKLENFIIKIDFEYGPLYAQVGECDL